MGSMSTCTVTFNLRKFPLSCMGKLWQIAKHFRNKYKQCWPTSVKVTNFCYPYIWTLNEPRSYVLVKCLSLFMWSEVKLRRESASTVWTPPFSIISYCCKIKRRNSKPLTVYHNVWASTQSKIWNAWLLVTVLLNNYSQYQHRHVLIALN